MALNLKRKMISANFNKLIATHIFNSRRATHASTTYERNVEEDAVVSESAVAEEMMPAKPNTYWAPHPKTGVYVPVDSIAGGVEVGRPPATSGDGGSPLYQTHQTAWFRPLEDVDKPRVS